MKRSNPEILSPVGATAARYAGTAQARRRNGKKPTIGLLDNSKPNVAFFLAALEEKLKTEGYATLNVTKPRSAGPSPDIELLAARCDCVINAVAD